MDVIILDALYNPILTVATVWNTGETGEIHSTHDLQFFVPT